MPNFKFSHPFLVPVLVEHIFNRKDVIKSVTTTTLETSRSDENKNVVASNGISLSSSALDSTVSQNVAGRAENPGLETGLVA